MSPMIRTRRRVVVVAAAVAVVIGGVVAYAALTGPLIVIPDDPCTDRPPLVRFDGVRLQPVAMKAFRAARREAGREIPVVESYRSCAQQRRACRAICGDPGGCPGLCAPAGLSWHQLGAAVDITQGSLDTPGVIATLRRFGWCESQPKTDPGHFSYGGCH